MKSLLSVDLIFENTEYVNIPIEAIFRLKINNVTQSYDFFKNRISTYTRAESIILILILNKIRNSDTVSRILRYNDITCLQLNYTGSITENIYVKYQGTEYNQLQQTVINNENLIIRIE